MYLSPSEFADVTLMALSRSSRGSVLKQFDDRIANLSGAVVAFGDVSHETSGLTFHVKHEMRENESRGVSCETPREDHVLKQED